MEEATQPNQPDNEVDVLPEKSCPQITQPSDKTDGNSDHVITQSEVTINEEQNNRAVAMQKEESSTRHTV